MATTLKNIATISPGANFRSKINQSPMGDIRIVQMRDLPSGSIEIDVDKLAYIHYEGLKPELLVQPGDIIFRASSKRNVAHLLRDETPNTIIANSLIRIRPDPSKVVAEYLVWAINQPASQRYFGACSKGSDLCTVSKHDLKNLEIPLPPIIRQTLIAELFILTAQEQDLLEDIKRKKEQYSHLILSQMASEESKDNI